MSSYRDYVSVGMVYRGDFNSSLTYYKNEVVSYTDNCSYVCIVDSVAPSANPLSGANWKKLIVRKDVVVSTVGTGTSPGTFILQMTDSNGVITIALNKVG